MHCLQYSLTETLNYPFLSVIYYIIDKSNHFYEDYNLEKLRPFLNLIKKERILYSFRHTVIVEIFNTIDSLKRATGINVGFYINVSFIYLRS